MGKHVEQIFNVSQVSRRIHNNSHIIIISFLTQEATNPSSVPNNSLEPDGSTNSAAITMHTKEMAAGIVHVGKTNIRYSAIAHKSGGNYK